MTSQRAKLFIGLGVVVVLVGVVYGIFFRDNAGSDQSSDVNAQVQEISDEDQQFSVARMFTLVAGQVVQADELDLRLVVNDIIYVPCTSNISNCKFTSFRADLTLSLISDPGKTDTVSFVGFPSEIRSLGKSLQITSATAQQIQLIIRGTNAPEPSVPPKSNVNTQK